MAQDATGTPTPLGIPKYNPAADAPSGRGFNAAMDAIDALLTTKALPPATAANQVPVWNGSNWAAGLLSAASLSASAGIAGTQLSAAANITGSQLAAAAGILGSQLAAAAAIAPSQLATGSVLELKVAGTTRKIAFGATTLTWPGGTQGSGVQNIAHGLGVVPIIYMGLIEGIGSPDFVYGSAAADSTNIQLAGWNPAGVQGAGTKPIFWLAIG
jgi:hypothetical protein